MDLRKLELGMRQLQYRLVSVRISVDQLELLRNADSWSNVSALLNKDASIQVGK